MKKISLLAALLLISCGSPRDNRENPNPKGTQNQEANAVNDEAEFEYRYATYNADHEESLLKSVSMLKVGYPMITVKSVLIPAGDICVLSYVGTHNVFYPTKADVGFLSDNKFKESNAKIVHYIEEVTTSETDSDCQTFAATENTRMSKSNPRVEVYFLKRTDDGSDVTKSKFVNSLTGMTFSRQ